MYACVRFLKIETYFKLSEIHLIVKAAFTGEGRNCILEEKLVNYNLECFNAVYC